MTDRPWMLTDEDLARAFYGDSYDGFVAYSLLDPMKRAALAQAKALIVHLDSVSIWNFDTHRIEIPGFLWEQLKQEVDDEP